MKPRRGDRAGGGAREARRSWRGRRSWPACVAALALLWSGAALRAQGPGGPPPASVRVGAADQRKVQDRWEVIGRLRELRRATVAAEVSGKVVEVNVDEGVAVVGGGAGRGTVLVRIDPVWAGLERSEAEARLEEAKAALTVAESTAAASRRNFEYLRSIAQTGAARPKEVRDAQDQAESDAASVTRAEAAVATSASALNTVLERQRRLEVRAPFDGFVVRKHVEVGQWLQPGSPVAEVVSRGDIDAVIDVPERLVNRVVEGAEIVVTVGPLKQEVTGKVRSVVPLGDNAARTFPVKVALDDQQGLLKPGMSVSALIPTEKQIEAITVPRDAVLQTLQGRVVWLAMDPGKAPGSAPGGPPGGPPGGAPGGGAASSGGADQAPPAGGAPAMPIALSVPVKVLFGLGDRFVVRPLPGGPPLMPGMPVVIEGAERILFPGQPLMIHQGAPPSEAAGSMPRAQAGRSGEGA